MAMILTLGFDPGSFARFDGLRRACFPPERNHIPAHLTLFQQLPDAHAPRYAADLAARAEATPPVPFVVDRLLDFGGGVALNLDMPGFAPLHGKLCAMWSDVLSDSDTRRRRPHVTVQNKVNRVAAQETLAQLGADFSPWRGVADRLLLWHYRGGPWDAAGRFTLAGKDG